MEWQKIIPISLPPVQESTRRRRLGKKPPMFASDAAVAMLNQLSKAALLDTCWCLAQLGTDESEEQIITKLAREIETIAVHRGDRLPDGAAEAAQRLIDSDPSTR